MLVGLYALLLSAPAGAACKVDGNAMLALDFRSFDQDLNGGWRALASKPGCEEAAADLIARYRDRHPKGSYLLRWHEGQLRLGLGQVKQAVDLFGKARQQPLPGGIDTGWNSYVDATMAFARRDRRGLLAARARLASLPMPPKWPPNAKWPMNLDVVDGLIACFGKPYKEAYSLGCRPRAEAL